MISTQRRREMQEGAGKAEALNALSGQILDAAIEVHRVLGGPGLLEGVYEEALALELGLRGLGVQRQLRIPVIYKGLVVKNPLVVDLLVSGSIIVEIKSVEQFNPIFLSQLLTYLRITGLTLGLVINFGERYVKNGYYRVVNKFPEI
ncbi:MAG: GxxExxY protein [Trichloromonadaceae bacterium]